MIETSALDGLRIKDEHLRRALLGQEFLLFDGGMGTILQQRGILAPGQAPDLLCITNPDDVTEVQRSYVEAGAEVITTNTFGANALNLSGNEHGASVADCFSAAVQCARNAGAPYVAGDMGPLGVMLEPAGTLSAEEAYDLFAEEAKAATDAGADLLILETFTDLREAKIAFLAAKENSDLPVFITMSFGQDGRTFMGTPAEVAASLFSAMGAQAVGVNCSLGPVELVSVVRTMRAFADVPIIAQPNAGLPEMVDGKPHYVITAEAFAQAMEVLVEEGASIIGGCCGTNPTFVQGNAALTQRVGAPVAKAQAAPQVVSTAKDVFALADILPDGISETFALTDDVDDLIDFADDQEDEGISIVAVAAEEEIPVEEYQQSCSLPLCIECAQADVLEPALRQYVGIPAVRVPESLLPIARKYGAIAL